ncbi:MAG: hypothetical protein ACM3IJ_00485 [Candidatus Levyibacteriota bacterium]
MDTQESHEGQRSPGRGIVPFKEGFTRSEDSRYFHVRSQTFRTPLGDGYLTASKIKRPEDAVLEYHDDELGVGIDESGEVITKPATEMAREGYNSIGFFVDYPSIGRGFEHSQFTANIWIPGTSFIATRVLSREENPDEEDYMIATFKIIDKETKKVTNYFLRDGQLTALNFNITTL